MVCSLNTQINNFYMNLNNASQFIRKNYTNYIQLLILICSLYILQLLTLLFVCGVSWNHFIFLYLCRKPFFSSQNDVCCVCYYYLHIIGKIIIISISVYIVNLAQQTTFSYVH